MNECHCYLSFIVIFLCFAFGSQLVNFSEAEDATCSRAKIRFECRFYLKIVYSCPYSLSARVLPAAVAWAQVKESGAQGLSCPARSVTTTQHPIPTAPRDRPITSTGKTLGTILPITVIGRVSASDWHWLHLVLAPVVRILVAVLGWPFCCNLDPAPNTKN